MESLVLRLPQFIMNSKGLLTREFEGEALRWTEKGVLVKARPILTPSDYCRRCGRKITNPVSMLVGHGPECSEILGIPRNFDPDDAKAIRDAAAKEGEVETWFPIKYAFTATGEAWSPPPPTAEEQAEAALKDAELLAADQVKITSNATGPFYVEFPYNKRAVALVKDIPGRKWDSNRKIWTVPKASGADLVSFFKQITGHEPTGDWVVEYQSVLTKRSERMELSKAKNANVSLPKLKRELHPFQKAGVKYALDAERAIFGDEPGLGKTIQALTTVIAKDAWPCAAIVPATVKINWQNELNMTVNGKTAYIISGTKPDRTGLPKADLYIVNYDILPNWVPLLKQAKLKSVIFDEFHLCKTHDQKEVKGKKVYKTKRVQACYELAQNVDIRLGLTGTTVLNRPIELASQLDIIGRLHEFGGFWEFATRYCGAERGRFGWTFNGATNLKELNERLRGLCYIRREKRDVLTELPDKQTAIIPLELTNRAEYNGAVDDLISYLREEAVANRKFQASISKLPAKEKAAAIKERQDDATYKAQQAEHLVRINALKQLTARGKLPSVLTWIENFLESGEKLVVFAHHKHIVQGIAAHFNAPYISGDVPLATRQQAVDMFQNNPNCRLIVLNMQAGGVGITLTAASNVAFVELGWTPALHQQAEDRCHRIGQKNAVTAWYLLANDTIDEDIARLLDQKKIVTTAVNSGDEVKDSEGIMNQLIETLLRKGK